jgi:hypothetical protein
MTKTVTTALLAIALATAIVTPSLAHHSGAMFEEKKTVTMVGVVKEFQWTNPHSWLLVTVTNPDGRRLDPQKGFEVR